MVEVMVSLALVSVLVLLLNRSWAIVGEQFLRLELRQRAVYALNGEVERFVILSREDRLGDNANEIEAIIKNSQNREIYDTAIAFVSSDENDFSDDADAQAGMLLHYTDVDFNKNLVWLDKSRNIVGVLTFVRTDMDGVLVTDAPDTDPNGANPCFLERCKLVDLYVEYPYRFQAGPLISTHDTIAPIEIRVRTIVGLKQPDS